MKNKPIIRTAVIILSWLLSTLSIAQTTLKGQVLEDKSLAPIPYATVYIDGTSNGTITDENGTFELTDVRPPAKLVVSHLSYFPQVKQVFVRGDLDLNFSLEKRRQEIEQVKVEAENERAKNIQRFKRMFVGSDYWGREAVILNDSVLFFQKTLNEDSVIPHGFFLPRNRVLKFEVTAKEPLLIDLPRLGYTLHVDLVYFHEEVGRTSAFSYNYYKPYEVSSSLKIRKIDKNRQKAYYNSIQHFCRAFFAKNLEQEGYGLYYAPVGSSSENSYYTRINIDSNLVQVSENDMAIIGFGDCTFLISYFYNSKGEPSKVRSDLLKGNNSTSSMYIANDSCVFTKDGILPESSIVFGGALGRKRTGGMLPKYYELPTK